MSEDGRYKQISSYLFKGNFFVVHLYTDCVVISLPPDVYIVEICI